MSKVVQIRDVDPTEAMWKTDLSVVALMETMWVVDLMGASREIDLTVVGLREVHQRGGRQWQRQRQGRFVREQHHMATVRHVDLTVTVWEMDLPEKVRMETIRVVDLAAVSHT